MAGEQKFTRLGAALIDLEMSWQDRLMDAEVLLAAGRNASAIAMGLYALEIVLKALICKRLDLPLLPKAFEIHDLDGLLLLSGLTRRIEGASQSMIRVKRNWDRVRGFSYQLNDLRYLPDERWSHDQAREFLKRIQNSRDGVVPWLLKQS